MAGQNFTLTFDAKLNVSQMKGALNEINNALKGLKLPQNLTKDLQDTFTKLSTEVKNFETALGKDITGKADFSRLEKSADKVVELFNKLKSQMKDIAGLSESQLQKLFPESVTKNIQNAKNALAQYQNSLKSATKDVDDARAAVEKLNNQIQQEQGKNVLTGDQYKQLGKDLKAAENEVVSLQEKLDKLNQAHKQLGESLSQPNKSSTYRDQAKEIQELTQKLEEAKKKAQDLAQIKATSTTFEKQTKSLTDLTAKYDEAKKKLDEFEAKLKEVQSTNDGGGLKKLLDDIGKFTGLDMSKFTADAQGAGEAIRQYLNNNLQQMATNIQQAGQAIEGQSGTFNTFKQNMAESADANRRFNDSMREVSAVKSRIQYFLGLNNAINLFKRAVRGAINTVKELDAAMTETAVVTNFSISDMWSQLPEYTARANELGVSTKAAYEAATLYYQQGLQTNEVMAMSTETLKMARIAGLDAAEATDRMTNAVRGFNMEINETNAQRVNDVYSQLAAKSASNVDEISTAMTKVASLAHNANMEFETTAAFLAQIIETTRESAETAGTALKTVVARFSEVKKLVDEGLLTGAGEDGEFIDVNKVSAALRTAGIDLNRYFLDEVGLDDIFMELAEKWDTLTTMQQRYIATQAAGSRQQSRFIALMSDYARTQELVGEAYGSAGASAKQFEKTQDSLQSKLARLSNAWNAFLMGLANSNVIKGAVDALTWLINGVNNLTDVFGKNVGTVLKWAAAIGTIRGLRAIFANGGLADKALGALGNTRLGSALGLGTGAAGTKFNAQVSAAGTGFASRVVTAAAEFAAIVKGGAAGAAATNVAAQAGAAGSTLLLPGKTMGGLTSLLYGLGTASSGNLFGKLGGAIGKTKIGGSLIGSLSGGLFGGVGGATAAATGLTGLVAGLGAVAAAAGITYVAIKKIYDASPQGQLKALEKQATALRQEADEARATANELKDVTAAYQEKNQAVQEANSVAERSTAIESRNDYILSLLEQDATYAKYIQSVADENGSIILTLDEDALAEAAVKAAETATNAAMEAYAAAADRDRQQAIVDQNELDKKQAQLSLYEDLNNENPGAWDDIINKTKAEIAQLSVDIADDMASAAKNAMLSYQEAFKDTDWTSEFKNDLSSALGEINNILDETIRFTPEQLQELGDLKGLDGLQELFDAINNVDTDTSLAGIEDVDQMLEELGITAGNGSSAFEKLASALNLDVKQVDALRKKLQNYAVSQQQQQKQAQENLTSLFKTIGTSASDQQKWLEETSVTNQERATKLSIDVQPILNTKGQKNLLHNLINSDDVGDEIRKAQTFINSLNMDEPIASYHKLYGAMQDTTNKVISTLARNVVQSNQSIFSSGNLVQSFLSTLGGKYEDVQKEVDKLIKKNGKLTAADIIELADSCEDLANLLDDCVVSAEDLADVLTWVEDGAISIDSVTDAVLDAIDATTSFQQIVEELHDYIANFDEGIDYGEGVDFFTNKVKELKDLVDNFEFGNERTMRLWEAIFGENYMEAWEKGEDQMRARIEQFANWVDNDAYGFFADKNIQASLGLEVVGDGQIKWDLDQYSNYDDLISGIQKAASDAGSSLSREAAMALLEAYVSHGDIETYKQLEKLTERSITEAMSNAFKSIDGTKIVTEDELNTLAKAWGTTTDHLVELLKQQTDESFLVLGRDALTDADVAPLAEYVEGLLDKGSDMIEQTMRDAGLLIETDVPGEVKISAKNLDAYLESVGIDDANIRAQISQQIADDLGVELDQDVGLALQVAKALDVDVDDAVVQQLVEAIEKRTQEENAIEINLGKIIVKSIGDVELSDPEAVTQAITTGIEKLNEGSNIEIAIESAVAVLNEAGIKPAEGTDWIQTLTDVFTAYYASSDPASINIDKIKADLTAAYPEYEGDINTLVDQAVQTANDNYNATNPDGPIVRIGNSIAHIEKVTPPPSEEFNPFLLQIEQALQGYADGEDISIIISKVVTSLASDNAVETDTLKEAIINVIESLFANGVDPQSITIDSVKVGLEQSGVQLADGVNLDTLVRTCIDEASQYVASNSEYYIQVGNTKLKIDSVTPPTAAELQTIMAATGASTYDEALEFYCQVLLKQTNSSQEEVNQIYTNFKTTVDSYPPLEFRVSLNTDEADAKIAELNYTYRQITDVETFSGANIVTPTESTVKINVDTTSVEDLIKLASQTIDGLTLTMNTVDAEAKFNEFKQYIEDNNLKTTVEIETTDEGISTITIDPQVNWWDFTRNVQNEFLENPVNITGKIDVIETDDSAEPPEVPVTGKVESVTTDENLSPTTVEVQTQTAEPVTTNIIFETDTSNVDTAISESGSNAESTLNENISSGLSEGGTSGAAEIKDQVFTTAEAAAEFLAQQILSAESKGGTNGAAQVKAQLDSNVSASAVESILNSKLTAAGYSAGPAVASAIQSAIGSQVYTINVQANVSGLPEGAAIGGIVASGSAAKGGKVESMAAGGVQKLAPGVALTGEEGPEIVWNKEKGYAYITGEEHPEFQNLQLGDRVFDAETTRKILQGAANGGQVPAYATGRWDTSKSSSNKSSKTRGSSSRDRSSSDRDSSSSSSEKTPTIWENELDWLYNLMEDIAELERRQTKLSERHDRYLNDISKTGRDLYNVTQEQLNDLYTMRSNQIEALTRRRQEMADQIGISGYSNYVQWNDKDQTLEIDWDAIEALQDKDMYDEIKDLIDKAEKIQDEMDTAKDALWDLEKEIKELEERYLEAYTEFQSRILDAVVNSYQQVIDNYSSLNDTLNNTNSAILNSLKQEIDLSRQIRDNTKTEQDISDMEARLAYLRRDTTGGNAQEIRQLEEQLRESRENYSDKLIDQAISNLSDSNARAEEQRQKQIELMTEQLDYWQESGALWAEVTELLTMGMGEDGSIIMGSELETLLRDAEDWKAMSEEQKEVWANDLILAANQAGAYLIKINEGLTGKSEGVWATIPETSITSQKLWYDDNESKLARLGLGQLSTYEGTQSFIDQYGLGTVTFTGLDTNLYPNNGNLANNYNSSYGDSYFDLTMNVGQLSSDYDVDQLTNRIKANLYDSGIYRNLNTLSFGR